MKINAGTQQEVKRT